MESPDLHAVDLRAVELVEGAFERIFVGELGDAFVPPLLVGGGESHLTRLSHKIFQILPTHYKKKRMRGLDKLVIKS